jgi:putative transposase
MKRVRLTYEGAYHHAVARGINGEDIFNTDQHKAQFLNYLEESSKKFKIRILAYCIMSNHYHLILENTTGMMSDFFRHLNGQYGRYYRKIGSSSGYVFQSRFKSTLIQDDSYLKMAIGYVLLNPVRAGMVSNFAQYIWSSAREYFSGDMSSVVDNHFVIELFGSKEGFIDFLDTEFLAELPILQTRYGELLGRSDFLETAVSRFDRRERCFGDGMKRIDDRYFEPVDKVIWEFERAHGVKIEDLDITSYAGKRQRGELLVRLKDLAGLRYSEINKIFPFDNLQLVSFPKLYRDAKHRLQESTKKS